MRYGELYQSKRVSMDEIVREVKSGDSVYVHPGGSICSSCRRPAPNSITLEPADTSAPKRRVRSSHQTSRPWEEDHRW